MRYEDKQLIKNRKGKYANLFYSFKAYRWCTGAWTSINQRSINGLYAGSQSIRLNNQQNSYRGKGITVDLDKMEFCQWVATQQELIKEIYQSGDKPNIDRIDGSKGYTIENIQILSSKANHAKRRQTKKKSNNVERYGKIYSTVTNRKQYLKAMAGVDIKEQPFDTLILTLPPSKVCEIILKSREEAKAEIVTIIAEEI